MLIYPLFIGWWEIVVILLIFLLLFGGKKIPEMMKGLGKGIRSFKQGLNEVDEQINQAEEKPSAKKQSGDRDEEKSE